MSYFEGQEDNMWMSQEQEQAQMQETFNMLQPEMQQQPSPLITDFSSLSGRPSSSGLNPGGVVRQEQTRGHARSSAPYRRPQSVQPRQAQHPQLATRQVSHSSEPSPNPQYSPVCPDVIPRTSTLTTTPIEPTVIQPPLRHPPYPSINPAALHAPYHGQFMNSGLPTTSQYQLHSHIVAPAPIIPVGSFDSQKKRFRPRADTAYNVRAKHLTHVCELPGVKRSDIKLSLSVCLYNGIRVIELEGISRPFFPFLDGDEEEGIVRERHAGKFYRMFPVPFDTNEQDVVASMADGLLILRIHCRSAPNSKAEVEASRRLINIVL